MKCRAWLAFGLLCGASSYAASPTLSGYGIFLPYIIGASSATESFSQPNLSAYTAAANPLLAAAVDHPRTSFQVAQSRVGLLVKTEPHVMGRMEFDFIDFSKSTPSTASLPRVRRALVEYAPDPHLTLKFGQDWDLVSPLAPHTYNLVGHYFESGDVGFMRIQLQALYKNENFEHAVAIGFPGNNNTASDGNLELGLMPTIAIRETYFASPQVQLGVSILGTSLDNQITRSGRFFAGVANAFFQAKTDSFEFRSEVYVGEETFNLGLLGLSYRNQTSSTFVRDAGAYATLRYPTSENLTFFGGVGGAWVLNPEEMLSSYTYNGAIPVATGTGPGIERNLTLRAGADYKLGDKFVVYLELAGLFTRHHLLSADLATHERDRHSYVAQWGGMLTFD